MSEVQAAGLLCPKCKVALLMSDRQNIEIDYCPICRGVWLDRGELDKIIERSLVPEKTAPEPTRQTENPPIFAADQGPWGNGGHHGKGRQSRGHSDGYGDRHERGKGSFLQRLFD